MSYAPWLGVLPDRVSLSYKGRPRQILRSFLRIRAMTWERALPLSVRAALPMETSILVPEVFMSTVVRIGREFHNATFAALLWPSKMKTRSVRLEERGT